MDHNGQIAPGRHRPPHRTRDGGRTTRSGRIVTACRNISTIVDIAATPDELWTLFWFRAPRSQSGDVTIEILHPGDAVGEGLVRHCTFRVPRYLLSGGRASPGSG